MTEPQKPPRKISVLFSFVGMAAACALAVWAGVHYMSNNASLFYGLIAGLSFGAAFAFGQQVKNHFIPPRPASTAWKDNVPSAADLSSAKQNPQGRKISVVFDDTEICTMAGNSKREVITWEAVAEISIRISKGPLPQPEWIITGPAGSSAKGVRIPNDADGLDALQDAFKARLPGYDDAQTYDTVIAAMAATEGSFQVWRKTA